MPCTYVCIISPMFIRDVSMRQVGNIDTNGHGHGQVLSVLRSATTLSIFDRSIFTYISGILSNPVRSLSRKESSNAGEHSECNTFSQSLRYLRISLEQLIRRNEPDESISPQIGSKIFARSRISNRSPLHIFRFIRKSSTLCIHD